MREWMKYVTGMKGGLKMLVPEGFIFFSTRTMGMRTYSGFRAGYRHFLERNGFNSERMNLHRFRHSYAVAAIKSGDDIKTVQGNLGHATESFTLDIYGHVTDQMKHDSAERMQKFIRSVSG